MNHITLAKELHKRCNVKERGFGAARLAMLKMGLSGDDIIKVTNVLKSL